MYLMTKVFLQMIIEMKKSILKLDFLSLFNRNSAGEAEPYCQNKYSKGDKGPEVVKCNHYDHANAQEYFNRGIVKMRLGNYTEAVKYFKQAIEFNPDMTKAYFNLGLSYQHLNDFENAIYYSRRISDPNRQLTSCFIALM
jgi:tetratricopeptide (TPR) repeat protein